ncbi:MAG: endonuclease domain-containing protein [Acidimicrobiales bacterium]
MASHRGAGWLWGLGDLHLDVSGRLQRSPGPGVVVHRRPAGDLRAVRRNGVPCTGALRTVVDLAALDDAALVEQALDRGVAVGLFTVAGVEAELARRSRRGRPGVVLLRRCLAARLDQRGGGPTSVLESAMDRLLRRHCLPLPERQYRLPGTPYRLDYAWPAARLVVEVDGYASHSGLDAFRADRARQNALVLAGWTVLRFTWADVHRRPRWVAGQIQLALAAQTA